MSRDQVYVGMRLPNGRLRVVVSDPGKPSRNLSKRADLWNHSPDGFESGYNGSGPAQLALAILADHLGDDARAVRLHQRYKERVVALLPRDRGWELSGDMVQKAVDGIEAGFLAADADIDVGALREAGREMRETNGKGQP